MLSSSTGLLRTACLQSHSHPLQCKALELCFNVALNRLPTSSASTSMLGPRSSQQHPCLSNALAAAFKRAQAHQRRGSIDNQQQPILALKVELEQLVISILDDPSVSRVMREAGFSSPQVKINVEKHVPLEIPASQFTPPPPQPQVQPLVMLRSDDDVRGVLDTLMKKKRENTIIVGECLGSAESVFKGVMERVERGEVDRELRNVQFVSLPLFSLKNLGKEVVEEKLGELWNLVKTHVGRGVVLYLGDLKWITTEFRSSTDEQRKKHYYSYCPLEHIIMELSRLVCAIGGGSGRLWLMGIATFKTYMSCRKGHPSLETLWDLHPLTIPVGSLGLSLNLQSDQLRSRSNSKEGLGGEVEKELNCCRDCSANFSREAQSIASSSRNRHNNHDSIVTSTSSRLPSWLQQYKQENTTINHQDDNKMTDLCKKWNSICSAVHKKSPILEKGLSFSPSPTSSTSVSSSYDEQCSSPKLHQTLATFPLIFAPKWSPKEHQFLISSTSNETLQPNLKNYFPNGHNLKPDLLSNPNSSPNSASSSEVMEDDNVCLNRFKELNSSNLTTLCNALEKKVPWQREIIPDIVNTLLKCRSGKMKLKNVLGNRDDKQETWFFFLGTDFDGKEKIGIELAKLVFGSRSKFVPIGLSNLSAITRADSTEEISKKRRRDESGSSYFQRFAEAVQENHSRVFFMEDIEQVDYISQMGIRKAIESGRMTLPCGELVHLHDAIVIFSCESFSSMSRACSPLATARKPDEEEEDDDDNQVLDLNIATEDDGNGDDHSVGDVGILGIVDRQFIFKF